MLELVGLGVSILLEGFILVRLMWGRATSDSSELVSLLKAFMEEQRSNQVNLFVAVQESISKASVVSREETNRQLTGFQQQVDNKLAMIQRSSLESSDRVRDIVTSSLEKSSEGQFTSFDKLQQQIDGKLSAIQKESLESIDRVRDVVTSSLQKSSGDQTASFDKFQQQVETKLVDIQKTVVASNERVGTSLQKSREGQTASFNKFQSSMESKLSSKLLEIKKAGAENNTEVRKSLQDSLRKSREEQSTQFDKLREQIDSSFTSIRSANSESIDKINATLEDRVKSLQESNEKRLEQIQGVVDEKLQKTLETRLSQSFELVSKQLESVGQGLGEMKALAEDARSLKNALSNIKDRGTYGEIRLEKLLSDILTTSQYESNIEIANGYRVEFAVKLPGNGDSPLYLPIDSKFPIEDYNRLLEAEDKASMNEARKALARRIRTFAQDIHDKYIAPPKTTDFALMFLPTEGLYAEVAQNVALFEELRDKYKVIAVGATTLSAFLASLQIGFKTLAIERRSQEVWNTLQGVKSEFIRYNKEVDKAQNQLRTLDKTLSGIIGARTKKLMKSMESIELWEGEDSDDTDEWWTTAEE